MPLYAFWSLNGCRTGQDRNVHLHTTTSDIEETIKNLPTYNIPGPNEFNAPFYRPFRMTNINMTQ